MAILTDNLTYNKESNTLSGYASDLKISGGNTSHVVYNPKTQMSQYFNFIKADMDGSGEDTYGWNYQSKEGVNLLIIND